MKVYLVQNFFSKKFYAAKALPKDQVEIRKKNMVYLLLNLKNVHYLIFQKKKRIP